MSTKWDTIESFCQNICFVGEKREHTKKVKQNINKYFVLLCGSLLANGWIIVSKFCRG